MTPDVLCRVHAASFPHAPWSAGVFETMIAAKGMIWRAATQDAGFVFVQTFPPEAEIITLATDPEHRRRGVARKLLSEIISELRQLDVRTLMLEVSADNDAALSLYASFGFTRVGLRKGYYARKDADAMDAIVLKCEIRPMEVPKSQESVDPLSQTRP